MVRAIREVERTGATDAKYRPQRQSGQGDRTPQPRRRRANRQGEAFSTANLTSKRPGDGLAPTRYWDLLGRPASRAYAPDEAIEP